MSLIYLLNDDTKWQEFLNKKLEVVHLPSNLEKKYRDFINNKKYKKIVEKITNNNYTFSIPTKILIGKSGNNKKRTVYTFNEDENYVLKMITFLLYKYDYLFSPNLYSFRKNSSVKKAIYNLISNKNINNLYGYKIDIKNYFNSIEINILLNKLKFDLKDDLLYNFFKKILTNKYVNFKNNIIEENKGAMAGIPISSFFANYYLKDLDKYFFDNNIIYFRYADDIILFDKDINKINEYKQYIYDHLKNLNLDINKEKEYFYNPNDEFEFLGFSYKKGTIDLSNNSIKKIKGKIKRSARGLRRWKIRKNATDEITLKAMNRKFNRKFFGKNETDLTWRYWFFPLINTSNSLKKIDKYMQDWQRYIITGKHNKKNYEKVPYSFLKKCNYKSLVNEYYKYKEK